MKFKEDCPFPTPEAAERKLLLGRGKRSLWVIDHCLCEGDHDRFKLLEHELRVEFY